MRGMAVAPDHPIAVLWRSILVGALALAACQPSAEDSQPADGGAKPPDVYLLTIDTLRADATGVYDARKHTPQLQRIAERSEVFERALSPMPITKPAHFSIFTSLYPREHGVLSNAVSLPKERTVLAEVLHQRGYQTAGFVSVRLLGVASGAVQGFQVFNLEGIDALGINDGQAVRVFHAFCRLQDCAELLRVFSGGDALLHQLCKMVQLLDAASLGCIGGNKGYCPPVQDCIGRQFCGGNRLPDTWGADQHHRPRRQISQGCKVNNCIKG